MKKKVGNLGDLAFYSTEHSKVLNTVQGGIAVANTDELGCRLRAWSRRQSCPCEQFTAKQLRHVIYAYYCNKHFLRALNDDIVRLLCQEPFVNSTSPEELRGERPAGYGARMSAPIASIGVIQLAKAERYNSQRRLIAKRWDKWCDKQGYARPVVIPGSTPIFLRYPVLVEPEKKRNVSWAAKELGVSLGVWFTSNLHPVDVHLEGCQAANVAVERCVNLPCLM